jgi:hypothetical protein
MNEGSLQMSVAEKAGQLLLPQRAAATRRRLDRGSFFRALYLAAVIFATIGWLWLIASTAMQLL